MLPRAEAGQLNALLFEREAYVSLAVALLLVLIERSRSSRLADAGVRAPTVMTAEVLLPLGALFVTIVSWYGLQPMIPAARAGTGRFTFAQLHAASVALYGLKTVLVVALAWRLSSPRRPSSSG